MVDKSESEETLSFELKIATGPHGMSTVPSIEYLEEKIQQEVVPTYREGSPLNGEGQATLLTFFALAHAAIELRSIEILKHKLADEKYQNDRTNDFFEGMSQKQREELLLRCGLIPSHVHSYLNTARGARNEIIHNPQQSFLPDIDGGISNAAEKTVKAVQELEDIYVDIYWPEDLD